MRRPAAEQPAIREDRAGLDGKSERPILPEKPGNAGGGKGPWFKSNARRSKGKEIGVSLITPESVWQLQEALHAKALVCERMNPLERKPDAGDSHVRFDERGVETECRRDIQAPATARAGHGYGPTYTSPRHSSTLRAPWKGAELQWERKKPTRQLTLQPVAAEAGMEAMKCSKPLVQKARSRVSEPAGRNANEHRASPETI